METAKKATIFIAISIFLILLMVNNQKSFFDSFLEVFKTDEVSTKLLMDVAGDSLINPDFCISLESDNTRNKYDNDNFTLFYVVGHAYGDVDNYDKALDLNLLDYFDKNITDRSNYLVLTGDFIKNDTLESLITAKDQIETYFDNYLIAPGNHDFSEDNDNYISIFNKDLFYTFVDDVLLISANFNNTDWFLDLDDQETINKLITDYNPNLLILFSHQIFWYDLFDEVRPNSFEGLKNIVVNKFEWIEDKELPLVSIAGDSGVSQNEIFCSISENKLFIASGIGGFENDHILKMYIHNSENIYFEKVYLNR